MSISDTYLDSFITSGKQSTLSIRNFYETILVTDNDNRDNIFRVPINDFFIKYQEQLSDITQFYNVPERMFYQPKTVSLELYGTTELWLSLLRVNGMRNITEFHLPIIKIYSPSDIKELISIFFKRDEKIT